MLNTTLVLEEQVALLKDQRYMLEKKETTFKHADLIMLKDAWKLLQQRVKARVNHKYMSDPLKNKASYNSWYQENYEPDFGCQHELRVGSMGDGWKWVCNPHRIKQMSIVRIARNESRCLIYSVGSNEL